MKDMTEEQIETVRKEWLKTIPTLTQYQCAELQRFAPSGHPLFDNTYDLYEAFCEHFKSVGGMTPGISKELGWGME